MEQAAPLYVYYAFGTILSVVVLVTLLGNGIAIYVFIKGKALDSANNILVFSLCICSFLEGLTGTMLSSISAFAGGWIFEEAGCYFHGTMLTFFSLSSISIISLISVVRAFKVWGSRHYKYFKSPVIYIWISVCVGFAFLYSIFPFMGWGSYNWEGIDILCGPNWKSTEPAGVAYCSSMLIVYFLVPMAVIVSSYGCVIKKLTNSKKRSCRKNYLVEKHVTVTVAIIIGAFLISWSPYAGISIYYTVAHDKTAIDPILETLPSMLAKFAAIWNPVIYFVRNSRYRKAFSELFPRLPCTFTDNATQTEASFCQVHDLHDRHEPTRVFQDDEAAQNSQVDIEQDISIRVVFTTPETKV